MADRVAVIGGGIIGCTATALLAEAGIDVILVEATAIGAGASGRNSGTIQHPFDPVLLPLHQETLEAYHALVATDPEFSFPSEPVGVLLLTDDLGAGVERAAELAAAFPDLAPEVLDPAATARAEPSLAAGWGAVRVATGYPVVPEAATHAMAARAVRAGATIRIGRHARPWVEQGDIRGVALDDGERLGAGAVLAAGGPWTPELLDRDPSWPPVARTWGVTIQVAMTDPPRHVLEEGVVHTINVPSGHVGSLFSLVAARGVATIGSTFLTDVPDPDELAPILLERGAAFVPALAGAEIQSVRICARPQSADGRPFIGPVPGVNGLWVCAGHGPWGMSTGPASAARVVEAMLDRASRIPAELRSDRAV
ncbi:MAG TPA: FAD-binding oxidoreductase [Candidatus Limnocylindria bacterium]|nr:FAD-binding oxidoreductase [Candidatus Limnocylindria bacterium]